MMCVLLFRFILSSEVCSTLLYCIAELLYLSAYDGAYNKDYCLGAQSSDQEQITANSGHCVQSISPTCPCFAEWRRHVATRIPPLA